MQVYKDENRNLNTQIIKVVDPVTGQSRLEQKVLGTNFETQSIQSGVSYKMSAVGEMNNEELDQLSRRNARRTQALEEAYIEAETGIPDAVDIWRANPDRFDIREKLKDQSINYPSYGRGLPPPKNDMKSFMHNEKMCGDKAAFRKKASGGSNSPQANVQAQQRKRILSPKRQRYETKFEQYFTKKNVDEVLYDESVPVLNFDTTTKPEGTKNAKVNQKNKYVAKLNKQKKAEALLKSLPTLEKDALEVCQQEVVAIMTKEMHDKLLTVFASSISNTTKPQDIVETTQVEKEELVPSIAEDSYFNSRLDRIVRESVDGVTETLEALLHRVLRVGEGKMISWATFIGFFTKRGRLREREKVFLQFVERNSSGSLSQKSDMTVSSREESFESKNLRLQKALKQRLINKQNLVPKTGKGKYDITVPNPFDFLNKPKSFSIRQKKVEKMIQEKNKEIEKALTFQYKARQIPNHVQQNKFEQLLEKQEKRKQDIKKLAYAKIKATEKPFSFFTRDMSKQKEKLEKAELPNNIPMFPHFKAGKIPWRILIPMYQALIDGEDDRAKKIKSNAELSLQMSKLPPRMEAYEKAKKDEKLKKKEPLEV